MAPKYNEMARQEIDIMPSAGVITPAALEWSFLVLFAQKRIKGPVSVLITAP